MAIEVELLAKLSDQVLEHIKELGLFDEMRMKLFNDLEASEEFSLIQAEFGHDIDEFCRKKAGQMNLPRAKLREQLNREQQQRFKSTDLLELNVRRLFRKHQHELRSLYNKQAHDYLLSLQQHQHHQQSQPKQQQQQLHHHKQQLQLQQQQQQQQNQPHRLEPPQHLNHHNDHHHHHQNRSHQQHRRRHQKVRKQQRRRAQQRAFPSPTKCHSKRLLD